MDISEWKFPDSLFCPISGNFSNVLGMSPDNYCIADADGQPAEHRGG
jgi:hypothetical protein